MSYYKRLTIRHPNSDFIGITETKQVPQTRETIMLLNRLAELEDKIENKTLIELPCKVGDKVYRKDGAWQVVGFECNRANGWKVKLERWKDRFLDCHETTKVVFSAFGKTVFLTKPKPEAEAKLRELKGEV